jgi:hypothetical protein
MFVRVPKNTVFQLFLSRFLNVSGDPKMDSNLTRDRLYTVQFGAARDSPIGRGFEGQYCKFRSGIGVRREGTLLRPPQGRSREFLLVYYHSAAYE